MIFWKLLSMVVLVLPANVWTANGNVSDMKFSSLLKREILGGNNSITFCIMVYDCVRNGI